MWLCNLVSSSAIHPHFYSRLFTPNRVTLTHTPLLSSAHLEAGGLYDGFAICC